MPVIWTVNAYFFKVILYSDTALISDSDNIFSNAIITPLPLVTIAILSFRSNSETVKSFDPLAPNLPSAPWQSSQFCLNNFAPSMAGFDSAVSDFDGLLSLDAHAKVAKMMKEKMIYLDIKLYLKGQI